MVAHRQQLLNQMTCEKKEATEDGSFIRQLGKNVVYEKLSSDLSALILH